MNKDLTILKEKLTLLKDTIEESEVNEESFIRIDWILINSTKTDLGNYIQSFLDKIKNYESKDITENLSLTIHNHIDNLDDLIEHTKEHFVSKSDYLDASLKNILSTLQIIFYDVESELFSYEEIQDKKLVPRALSTRLRSLDKSIEALEAREDGLSKKIATIDEAHEAAESLPTDLASLKDARTELTDLINSAKKELEITKQELATLRSEANNHLFTIKAKEEETLLACNDTKKASIIANELVNDCDDALQIATTEGLSAGFDQKAQELKKSINIWIFGLVAALVFGAIIGGQRVDAFSQALNDNLTAGQAVLHTIIAFFSIGGPLWLAWMSTQQINQRFKLAEDYSYKATVAKSFTGFKKQAERFAPDTQERLFNSTLDRLDEMPLRLIEGKDYNSPWHEFIDSDSFRQALDMVPALGREVGKFAGKTNLKSKVVKKKNSPAANDTQINEAPKSQAASRKADIETEETATANE